MSWWQFFLFNDPNIRYVTIGCILITASAAAVGTFTFLRKKALIGDAIGHSILPGLAFGFLLSGVKNPIYLALGAFISGWLSILLIDFISNKSRIKQDTAIALILSVFFGFGIVLLTYIQSQGSAAQSGLDQYLFGKAAALVGEDLWVFGGIALLILLTVIAFFKEFTLISFNREFALVQGFPVNILDLILSSLTVLAIVAGIQAVGVVLIAAMLITPPAMARYWTSRIHTMLFLAVAFGSISGIAGAFVSYQAPNMPTGPWIVVVASFLAAISFLFGTEKGLLHHWRKKHRIAKRIDQEHVLKSLFHLQERNQDGTFADLKEQLHMGDIKLKRVLGKLIRQGFIKKEEQLLYLSELGWHQAARVVRLHRLWELYLTEVLKKNPEQVHDEAEAIEHIISEETEAKLEAVLNYPSLDPHDSLIPR